MPSAPRVDQLEQRLAHVHDGSPGSLDDLAHGAPAVDRDEQRPTLAVEHELVDLERVEQAAGRQSSDGMTRRISRHCFRRRSTSTSASLSSTGSAHDHGAGSSAAKRNEPDGWHMLVKQRSTSRMSRSPPSSSGPCCSLESAAWQWPSARWTRPATSPASRYSAPVLRAPASNPNTSGSDSVSNVPWSINTPGDDGARLPGGTSTPRRGRLRPRTPRRRSREA